MGTQPNQDFPSKEVLRYTQNHGLKFFMAEIQEVENIEQPCPSVDKPKF